MTDAHVVGAGIIDFGEKYDWSFEDLLEGAYLDLVESVDYGVDPTNDIDGVWYGTLDIANEGSSGAAVAHATGFSKRPQHRSSTPVPPGAMRFETPSRRSRPRTSMSRS